jgi:hypothetical protein
MQNVKNQSRIWSWIVALVITSTMAVACNNEAKPADEPKADTPVVEAPAAPSTTDTLPKVDSPATTRPDGSNN